MSDIVRLFKRIGREADMANNPCTECGKPGIPGLTQGAGKCQYHWNKGVWGEAWANHCEQLNEEKNNAAET